VAVGSNVPQIFVRHLLPNLLPTLITVAALDMAGVLLLLAELGFLNIFMGGGARTEVLSESLVGAAKYYYSDVPEWGALLSTSAIGGAATPGWPGTRAFSSPWLFWPSIFGVRACAIYWIRSAWPESPVQPLHLGLRRYPDLCPGVDVAQRCTPGLYAPQTRAFNAQNVMADVEYLSSPRFAGREVGSPAPEPQRNILPLE